MSLSPQAKVVTLLRTLSEAREAYDVHGDMGGDSAGWPLPAIYSCYSYPELERCLSTMRDNGNRPLWWHLSYRYRFGIVKWGRVQVVRRNNNPRYIPPQRTEIIALGEHSGTWAQARLYCWSTLVDTVQVERGIDYLTSIMHNGNHWDIQVPAVFLERKQVAA